MTTMLLVGVISATDDPPGIDLRRWAALVASNVGLEPVALHDTSANIVVGGEVVGRMSWSSSTANEIDVSGDLEKVADVAWNVAAALGAHFVTLAELTSC
jgi:hypothetical protein